METHLAWKHHKPSHIASKNINFYQFMQMTRFIRTEDGSINVMSRFPEIRLAICTFPNEI